VCVVYVRVVCVCMVCVCMCACVVCVCGVCVWFVCVCVWGGELSTGKYLRRKLFAIRGDVLQVQCSNAAVHQTAHELRKNRIRNDRLCAKIV